jgi:photosystem II stability/assembly factor-like uncharacterized protein
MKQLYLLFCGYVILNVVACSKSKIDLNHVNQILLDTNIQLNNALAIDEKNVIIAAGERFNQGALFISTDTGIHFEKFNWKYPNDCKGFFGISHIGSTVYASSYGAFIAKSNHDVSSSFHPLNSFITQRIPGPNEFVSSIDLENEIGYYSINIGTDSGGIVTFNPSDLSFLHHSGFKYAIHDVKIIDKNKAIAVGSGSIITTKDAGNTWIKQHIIGDNFIKIAKISPNIFVAIGLSGTIVKSTDGGITWKKIRNGSNILKSNYQFWDVRFCNENEGFIVGEKGVVLFTKNQGESWKEISAFTSQNLRFILPTSKNKILVGGENGTLFSLEYK